MTQRRSKFAVAILVSVTFAIGLVSGARIAQQDHERCRRHERADERAMAEQVEWTRYYREKAEARR